MSEQEQVAYVRSKLMLVAQQMTKNAERGFPDEAIVLVKYWLDAYVRRIGTGSTRLWAEDLLRLPSLVSLYSSRRLAGVAQSFCDR